MMKYESQILQSYEVMSVCVYIDAISLMKLIGVSTHPNIVGIDGGISYPQIWCHWLEKNQPDVFELEIRLEANLTPVGKNEKTVFGRSRRTKTYGWL